MSFDWICVPRASILGMMRFRSATEISASAAAPVAKPARPASAKLTAVALAVERWGRLDCAHNNAGTSGTPAAFTHLSLDDWDSVVRLHLTGVFLCMKHELRVMAPAGSGAIVNTSSGAGVIGFVVLIYGAMIVAFLGVAATQPPP